MFTVREPTPRACPSTVGIGPFWLLSRRVIVRTARTTSGFVLPGSGVNTRVPRSQEPTSTSAGSTTMGAFSVRCCPPIATAVARAVDSFTVWKSLESRSPTPASEAESAAAWSSFFTCQARPVSVASAARPRKTVRPIMV